MADPLGGGFAGIRLSDADRDHLASALGSHYAAGRLDTAGLSNRLDVVYTAATREAAAAALAGLPPLEGVSAPIPAARGRRRRHGEASKPQAGWIPTTERFRDPTTRRLMRVWIDPADASRHYLAERD
ncbi:MAG: DUF1707 domain-containing protein [Actinobacteria bacterium]|nr:DUF1707 domain-containing protein [Actinomycetota bacterium]